MTPTIEVTEFGQIGHFVIPGEWVEKELQRLPMQLFTLREFHPCEKPDVRLYIYYRGHPVSERSGESFEALLDKPPHELDESEWLSVQEVVRDAALPEVFERRRARTYDWCGKRVLIVDGHWQRLKEDSFAIFINAADHGCQVQEIHFVSPTTDYQYYLPDALLALNSIRWKQEAAEDYAMPEGAPQASAASHVEALVRLDEVLEKNINDEFGLERGQRLTDAQLRTLERVTHLEPNILAYDDEGHLVVRLSPGQPEPLPDMPGDNKGAAAQERMRDKRFRSTLETLTERYKSEELDAGDL
ncbi:MAG TPA: hypothetical protein V6D08_20310 [Candidatus Obscuribacterales bacterium]